MTTSAARRLAEGVHAGTLDRYGQPLLDHVRRVAAQSPPEARAVAWLHEAFECSDLEPQDLRAAGLAEAQVRAIELLTRTPSGDPAEYEAHVHRIAQAPGRAGELARAVKRADLRDRLRHQGACPSTAPARPPYRRALTVLGAGSR